ncbi:hypothetical protein ITJ38_15540 [Agreia pratensis]|uniref:hypothetical protein n=1 Tax=Agreia pratensis TaxID=150121 RepID=UPI00188B8DC6|nr:hypothetical protein [Agreia pratensis]MBF4635823.1 hypothetical protein [Agreia pratensis]
MTEPYVVESTADTIRSGYLDPTAAPVVSSASLSAACTAASDVESSAAVSTM